ncbi:hypothetical protein CHGG_06192 [Chaetomium globosum CBS 148.51]|uniref:holo-[acyl-carrier-protein] synthase n=1 Tax=Chaetomium globosum (strain ATCC 6205 / CBS 148.51 / DSM 1962 / NBRC 6347 / NRRL 1970) TaxID=306901 RepID=Q2H573_CHAGB|nr:uncharacterized protein CHGG_06192 [Chaetomium globosum CBS 148.51]EAQ89573.1 hypothetical protein CHGG_06192 [Chaetomium globosum CBS 148.51]
MSDAETPNKPVIAQWILDTRSWYPEVTQTKQLETHAARAFALLPPTSRAPILRYHHARDAKMALASALLKHYAVARLMSTDTAASATKAAAWSATLATPFTRDARTKPVWLDPASGAQPVAFNVSHQAGVVAIVAVAGYRAVVGDGGDGSDDGVGDGVGVEVGVDVVCTSERRARDHAMLAGEGWPAFVDMHADVFAPGEVAYLKHRVLEAVPGLAAAAGAATVERVSDAKLRAFYTLWALREAYVKLTGEALLAEWLKDLEFRGFRPPAPTAGWDVPGREEEGEVVRDIEIWFKKRRVEDVNMCLRSMGEDYMIATAVRTPGRKEDGLGWELGPYEVLSLDQVLDFAEGSG